MATSQPQPYPKTARRHVTTPLLVVSDNEICTTYVSGYCIVILALGEGAAKERNIDEFFLSIVDFGTVNSHFTLVKVFKKGKVLLWSSAAIDAIEKKGIAAEQARTRISPRAEPWFDMHYPHCCSLTKFIEMTPQQEVWRAPPLLLWFHIFVQCVQIMLWLRNVDGYGFLYTFTTDNVLLMPHRDRPDALPTIMLSGLETLEPLIEPGTFSRKANMRSFANFMRSIRYDSAICWDDIDKFGDLEKALFSAKEWRILDELYKLPESFSAFDIPNEEYDTYGSGLLMHLLKVSGFLDSSGGGRELKWLMESDMYRVAKKVTDLAKKQEIERITGLLNRAIDEGKGKLKAELALDSAYEEDLRKGYVDPMAEDSAYSAFMLSLGSEQLPASEDGVE